MHEYNLPSEAKHHGITQGITVGRSTAVSTTLASRSNRTLCRRVTISSYTRHMRKRSLRRYVQGTRESD